MFSNIGLSDHMGYLFLLATYAYATNKDKTKKDFTNLKHRQLLSGWCWKKEKSFFILPA